MDRMAERLAARPEVMDRRRESSNIPSVRSSSGCQGASLPPCSRLNAVGPAAHDLDFSHALL